MKKCMCGQRVDDIYKDSEDVLSVGLVLVIGKESAESLRRGGTFLIVLVCTYM